MGSTPTLADRDATLPPKTGNPDPSDPDGGEDDGYDNDPVNGDSGELYGGASGQGLPGADRELYHAAVAVLRRFSFDPNTAGEREVDDRYVNFSTGSGSEWDIFVQPQAAGEPVLRVDVVRAEGPAREGRAESDLPSGTEARYSYGDTVTLNPDGSRGWTRYQDMALEYRGTDLGSGALPWAATEADWQDLRAELADALLAHRWKRVEFHEDAADFAGWTTAVEAAARRPPVADGSRGFYDRLAGIAARVDSDIVYFAELDLGIDGPPGTGEVAYYNAAGQDVSIEVHPQPEGDPVLILSVTWGRDFRDEEPLDRERMFGYRRCVAAHPDGSLVSTMRRAKERVTTRGEVWDVSDREIPVATDEAEWQRLEGEVSEPGRWVEDHQVPSDPEMATRCGWTAAESAWPVARQVTALPDVEEVSAPPRPSVVTDLGSWRGRRAGGPAASAPRHPGAPAGGPPKR